nr:exosome complex component CSL4 [Tanacetum cinerariifolium]
MLKEEDEMVTPGEVLGNSTDIKPGKGAYLSRDTNTVYASITGRRSRPTVEVIGHKAHGPVPEPGCVVIARVTKVMARMASADVMCVGSKSVREKFSGIIRANGVNTPRCDEDRLELILLMVFLLPKVEKVRIGVSAADLKVSVVRLMLLRLVQKFLLFGATMDPISWTEMQCPLTGQIEQRKVAKVGA